MTPEHYNIAFNIDSIDHKKVVEYAAKRRADLRDQLESLTITEQEANVLRGRLLELKELIEYRPAVK